MQILAALIRSAFDAGVALLGWMGMRGPAWEWRKSRWKMSIEAKIASWEMTGRSISAPLRMCRDCRELVERSVSVCPACGASMRDVPGGGAGRLLSAVLPGFSSLTAVILTLNVALLAIPLITWGTDSRGGGLFGILSPSWKALFVFGEKHTGAILELGQVWRLVTAGFLHGGLIHLAFNTYALSILGPLIENAFGWRKFLVIYLTCDIAAFGVSAVFSPGSPSVGASGPLFGLLGFGIIYGRFRAGPGGKAISDYLMQWIVSAVLMLFIPGIDNAAHAGGFACGALLAFLVNSGEPVRGREERLWSLLAGVAILVLAGSFLAMLLSYPMNLKLITG